MVEVSRILFLAAFIVAVFSLISLIISTFRQWFEKVTLVTVSLVWLLVTLSVILRTVATGHGPFTNMYEFAVAFTWGIITVGLLFWRRSKVKMVAVTSSLLSIGLMIFALTRSAQADYLVPALQQSTLLTLHVTAAIIAYGAFAVGFGVSVASLWPHAGFALKLPSSEVLEKTGYQAVIIGFPFMTLTIILGSVWAEISWGRYWGWDPKETASLVTWLLYAGYLHARVIRGWRGKKLSVLLVVGFCAVLFTFFGNFFFRGLHSY
jgi:ABC-type transport system involved in cytochrome c biogenesis permease subunit